jgi:hypothetical protein
MSVKWRAVSSTTGVRFPERNFFSEQVVFQDVTYWGYPEYGGSSETLVSCYQFTRCQMWRSSYNFYVRYKVHTGCHSRLSDQWYLVRGMVQYSYEAPRYSVFLSSYFLSFRYQYTSKNPLAQTLPMHIIGTECEIRFISIQLYLNLYTRIMVWYSV